MKDNSNSNNATPQDDDESWHDCPERDCGIEMPGRTELNAHLRWDHNRSESEAEAMLDAAGVAHAK